MEVLRTVSPLLALALACAPCGAPLAEARGVARSDVAGAREFLRPDRESPAVHRVDGELEVQFRVRPGTAYPVLRHGRKGRSVLVSLPGDPERSGWVRFSPAELAPPSPTAGPHADMTRHYSPGWATLYQAARDLEDGALEAHLRDMNRNLWTLGYDAARDAMYSRLDVRDGTLRCVYTGVRFPAGERPGPGPGGEMMNAEHTWPQSDFDEREPMRSDLHHLFPTESEANHERGSKDFQELDDDEGIPVGPLGARSTEDGFEPPSEHKGNVARALFYFAVQYQEDIEAEVERTLRAWHAADPPDAAERLRNHRTYLLQRSRNFFVDHPELVGRISDY